MNIRNVRAEGAGDATTDPGRAAAETRVRELYEQHGPAVFGCAIRLTRGDAAWAEDVVQETFVRAWRHWEEMTPEYGSVRGWLMRVAHNLVMDGYRAARRRNGELLIDTISEASVPVSPDGTDQVLSAQLVREALDRLPEAHRQVLEATYLLDQTATQAAHCLRIPLGTVKSRAFYGLRMLREQLGTATMTGTAA